MRIRLPASYNLTRIGRSSNARNTISNHTSFANRRPFRSFTTSQHNSQNRGFAASGFVACGIVAAGIGISATALTNSNVANTNADNTANNVEEQKAMPFTFSKDNDFGDIPHQHRMEQFIRYHQKEITEAIEKLDGGKVKFQKDPHKTGITMVLQDGEVFEKAGCAVTCMNGNLPPYKAKAMLDQHKLLGPEGFTDEELKHNLPYFVAGISLVCHPHNPHAPTVHFNYRYFEVQRKDGSTVWWFGGGADLTPTYVNQEDSVHFHTTLKEACDKTDPEYYPNFKKVCDDYFVIAHRNERRGVGGIFFDGQADRDKDVLFNHINNCASAFLPSYLPLVQKHKDDEFTEHQKRFQALRRGRYVEFNLVYDRGTKFGLVAAAHGKAVRVESILLSLPLRSRFEYMFTPAPGSPEEYTQSILRTPKDWI